MLERKTGEGEGVSDIIHAKRSSSPLNLIPTPNRERIEALIHVLQVAAATPGVGPRDIVHFRIQAGGVPGMVAALQELLEERGR